jgi:hypothetical protein
VLVVSFDAHMYLLFEYSKKKYQISTLREC